MAMGVKKGLTSRGVPQRNVKTRLQAARSHWALCRLRSCVLTDVSQNAHAPPTRRQGKVFGTSKYDQPCISVTRTVTDSGQSAPQRPSPQATCAAKPRAANGSIVSPRCSWAVAIVESARLGPALGSPTMRTSAGLSEGMKHTNAQASKVNTQHASWVWSRTVPPARLCLAKTRRSFDRPRLFWQRATALR